jgi:hypothetical protein
MTEAVHAGNLYVLGLMLGCWGTEQNHHFQVLCTVYYVLNGSSGAAIILPTDSPYRCCMAWGLLSRLEVNFWVFGEVSEVVDVSGK